MRKPKFPEVAKERLIERERERERERFIYYYRNEMKKEGREVLCICAYNNM